MSTTKEYLNFVLEQLSPITGITHRAMMGEYIIYINDKILGGIYDNRFMIKETPTALSIMPSVKKELPYNGAKKEMLLIEDLDDKDFLKDLIEKIYPELPLPKKKKK